MINANLGSDRLLMTGRIVTVTDGEEDVEGEFLDFFQRAPIALHWLSGTGHILWANDTELQVLGYSADEYIGQPVMKFCPDDEELVLEIFKQLGSGNTIKDVPVRFRTKTGELRHLLIDSNVNWNTDGSFRHTRCFIRDDTGRKIREAISAAEKVTAAKTASAIDTCLRRAILKIRKELFTTQNQVKSLDTGNTELRTVNTQLERVMGK
jgi:PAS domain S-box-containing protein